MVKISVIVPVYDSEKFLNRCVDSILNQSFQDFELLLIDDGSKDGSGKICEEYAVKDKRVRVYHKENGGVSSARNLGLDHAQGDWITFCDSDDWVEQNWLSESVMLMRSYNVDIIRFGYKVEYNGSLEEISNRIDEVVVNPTAVWVRCIENRYYGFLWNSVFTKKIVANHRFNENLRLNEDHIFTNTILLDSSKTFISSKCFYHYMKGQCVSLSNVCDPFVVYNAAIQTLETESRFTNLDLAYKERIIRVYHESLKASIVVAYKFSSYSKRHAFANQFVIHKWRCVSFGEVLFASRFVPFWIKDCVFRIALKIKGV